MSLDETLTPFYKRVDAEDAALAGWYGDVLTPVEVDWNNLTNITRARLIHAHDSVTGECKKNRAGVNCG